MRQKYLSVVAILAVASLVLAGERYEKAGATYAIAEPDALAEIEEKVASVDWTKLLDKDKTEKKVKGYRPEGLSSLPRAGTADVRLVDMSYTYDGPDVVIPCNLAVGSALRGAAELEARCHAEFGDEWKTREIVLYPNGYRFNPLDYLSYPNTLVVIDGDDPDQVEWFEGSEYSADIRGRLLIVSGSYYDLSESLKRPVFYADSKFVRRFDLRAVPSVIRQKDDCNGTNPSMPKRCMEVTEIEIGG